MALSNRRRAIGVFANENDLDRSLRELRDAGFPMDNVSVIAKDSDRVGQLRETDEKVGHEPEKGAKIGSVTGTALGMLAGLLAGVGTILVPGIGGIVATGTIGTTLGTTLAGGGVGAVSGGLVGALAGWGVPEDRAKIYSDRLAAGDFLLVIDGTPDEVTRAEMMLINNRGLEEWGIYNPAVDEPALSSHRS